MYVIIRVAKNMLYQKLLKSNFHTLNPKAHVLLISTSRLGHCLLGTQRQFHQRSMLPGSRSQRFIINKDLVFANLSAFAL